MYDYGNLIQLMESKGINRAELGRGLGLSSRTLAKIARGEKLAASTLDKIAFYLDVNAEDIYRIMSDNVLLQELRDEREAGISGGIYHELQIYMTYNSNHMEGSCLSESQTRLIFETNTIDAGDGIIVDDVLETVHHFRAIDYCIDNAEKPLSEDMIKELHYILKHDTKDAGLPWFAVGDYKKRVNEIGGKVTTKPADVQKQMKRLLEKYNAIERVSFKDIVDFHVKFERIHPFQDGNGRVGRLIAFKECLKNNIVPFVILDKKKGFYYRGLANYKDDKSWLMDTLLDGQDSVKALLDIFDIEYI